MSRPICLLLSIAVQAVLFLPMRDIEFDLSPTDTPLLMSLAPQAMQVATNQKDAATRERSPAYAPGLEEVAVQALPPGEEIPLAVDFDGPQTISLEEEPVFESATDAITIARETLPIPDAQRNMLRRKFERLAESIDELTPSGRRIVWEHEGQEYTAVFTKLPARDSMEIDEIVVEVSTEKGGARLTSDMRMKRLAFSNFVQFVDRWDGELKLHDDEFDGRFHSNQAIPIERSDYAQPIFHAEVTSAEGIDTSESTKRVRRSDVFLGGLTTRVRRIMLPKRFVPFPDDAAPGDENVHELADDTRIAFHADGTYSWSSAGSADETRKLPQHPYYIVGADDAELAVKGTVNGKVLIYARGSIVIEDDLVYASDPLRVPDSDDYLGLVSDGNVEIDDPETTGPGDLRVQAAIYATRQFRVRHHAARQDATLFIDGSLIAGYLSPTEPRFRTKLQFDQRLEDLRPPAFPVTDRYEVADWSGLWTVEASGS